MPFCPWAQATESLGAVSGMSIRLATDHLLETYPPVGPIYFPRMYGRVLKMPVGWPYRWLDEGQEEGAAQP